MQVDTPTIMIILILVNAMSAIAIFWAWIEHPTLGQRKWSLSLVVESAGLLLMLTQEFVTLWLSVVLAYGLNTAAFSFRYLSLCEFFERTPNLFWRWGPPVIAVVSAAILINQPEYRIPVINLIIAAQCGILLYLATTSSISGVNYSRKMLIIYAGAAAALFLFRALMQLSGTTTRSTVLEINAVNGFSLLGLLLLAVLSSFSILLILREKLDAENQKLATQDPLTSICNRRALIELAERELLRSYRTNRWPCLLMLDIDHFKEVNDQYGHLAGDQVLVALATLIADQLRDLDVVGRYGGEEFCILLAETDEEGGIISAERLRESIEKMVVKTDKGAVKITASIGLAFAHSGDTLDQLVARADNALYEAKAQGRNTVSNARS